MRFYIFLSNLKSIQCLSKLSDHDTFAISLETDITATVFKFTKRVGEKRADRARELKNGPRQPKSGSRQFAASLNAGGQKRVGLPFGPLCIGPSALYNVSFFTVPPPSFSY